MFKHILIGLVLILASGSALAADSFKEGVDYKPVVPAQPTSVGPNQVEVIEFFSFACPHCFEFEPHLEAWLKTKPDGIKFVRVPAEFNPYYALLARAWYTAEVLGVAETVTKPFFDAIHVQHKELDSKQALAAFFQQTANVPEDQFNAAFESFSVNMKLERAKALARRYRLSGVPTVIINGKYRTDAVMTQSYEKLIQVTDTLARQELNANGPAPANQQGQSQ